MTRRRVSHEVIADINITPFTDVVLVLLIIFMVATPLLMLEGMRTDLPKQSKQPVTQHQDTFINISIAENGSVTVNGKPYQMSELTALLAQMLQSDPNGVVTIGADAETLYDIVVKVIDSARAAGVTRYVLTHILETNKIITPH
jgi:biopolymer transport protein ExbD